LGIKVAMEYSLLSTTVCGGGYPILAGTLDLGLGESLREKA
jgi:hypothetical protein